MSVLGCKDLGKQKGWDDQIKLKVAAQKIVRLFPTVHAIHGSLSVMKTQCNREGTNSTMDSAGSMINQPCNFGSYLTSLSFSLLNRDIHLVCLSPQLMRIQCDNSQYLYSLAHTSPHQVLKHQLSFITHSSDSQAQYVQNVASIVLMVYAKQKIKIIFMHNKSDD